MATLAIKESTVTAKLKTALRNWRTRMLFASIVNAATEEPKTKTARMFFVIAPIP